MTSPDPAPATSLEIVGDRFFLNGTPTYPGRLWRGHRVEGLLFNARLVQGVFDDLNPATAPRWAYPDTGRWDPERNTREFIAAMPTWRAHGLLAFTLCLQGGSPEGYSKDQPWHNSAFDENGNWHEAYARRTAAILRRADELGMVVILSLFYFRQDHRLRDEAAVRRAVANTVNWVFAEGRHNVLLEINNETNPLFHHPILRPYRVRELIAYARQLRGPAGQRLYVTTSYEGGRLPSREVLAVSDFALLHGNKVQDPLYLAAMVEHVREQFDAPRPVVINEDDHYDFDREVNNFTASLSAYASWGYFDYRRQSETDAREGFQSVPVDWTVSTARKRAFFALLAEITGSTPPAS